MVEQQLEHKKKRDRSPGYPGIDLEEAISKASTLYRQESKHAAPVEVILQHWGYTSKKSSGGLVALAALKKFGLLMDEGTGKGRQARISEDAFHILVDDVPNSPERLRLIQKAALTPSIHQELWDQYAGNLPSDSTLKVQLRNRGFTERAATAFIEEFHHTISFAKLSASGAMSWHTEETPKEDNSRIPPLAKVTQNAIPTVRSFDIPLYGHEVASIKVPYPLSEDDWKQLEETLKLWKPTLVRKTAKAIPPDAPEPIKTDTPNLIRNGQTDEVRNLLAKVGQGGVPLYMTDTLRRIADDHGIEVTPSMTPNDIIERLKATQ